MKQRRLFLLFLLVVLVLGSVVVCRYALIEFRNIPVSSRGTGKGPSSSHDDTSDSKGMIGDTQRPGAEKGGRWGHSRPRVAIIIDDLGHHHDRDLSFVKLDLPLSLAILPRAPFTDALVHEAARAGREILLHQPMEPKDYPCVNPGPGALLLSMDAREIREILDMNMRQVPGARGINNHMGSSFTENREKMTLVLRELKKRGLFFIDSRTSKRTVGLEEATKIGVPAAQRAIFIDNRPDPEAICRQIERLIEVARESGAAIGIGHPYCQTVEMLRKYASRLKHEVEMVPVSELVR